MINLSSWHVASAFVCIRVGKLKRKEYSTIDKEVHGTMVNDYLSNHPEPTVQKKKYSNKAKRKKISIAMERESERGSTHIFPYIRHKEGHTGCIRPERFFDLDNPLSCNKILYNPDISWIGLRFATLSLRANDHPPVSRIYETAKRACTRTHVRSLFPSKRMPEVWYEEWSNYATYCCRTHTIPRTIHTFAHQKSFPIDRGIVSTMNTSFSLFYEKTGRESSRFSLIISVVTRFEMVGCKWANESKRNHGTEY